MTDDVIVATVRCLFPAEAPTASTFTQVTQCVLAPFAAFIYSSCARHPVKGRSHIRCCAAALRWRKRFLCFTSAAQQRAWQLPLKYIELLCRAATYCAAQHSTASTCQVTLRKHGQFASTLRHRCGNSSCDIRNHPVLPVCRLPPTRTDILAFTVSKAGTRFSDPGGMQG